MVNVGSESSRWSDLPVTGAQVLWLDVSESGTEQTTFLGTNAGLYAASGDGAPWKQIQGGLPHAAVTYWLRSASSLVATEQNGGMYLSRDRGMSWTRVDSDAERGQFTGLVRTGPETVLAGSQSEGVLELVLPQQQEAAGR